MHISGNLATEERLEWIRQQLESEGSIRLADAARELSVSEMTIRRDLQELEALGVARRVRGGAVAIGPQAFAERHRSRARAKSRIADKLLDLMPASGAVGFDASSTVLRLASRLTSGRDLTILTNGSEVFQALQNHPGITGQLTGGSLEPRTGSLVGPLACRAASSLLLQRLFLSAAAVDPAVGTSEACLEEAEVKRAMASVAAEVVLAVDVTKLSSRSVAVGIPWDQISIMATELDPADAKLDPYRDLVSTIV
jgi:DeoR family fructose operon transcriptional repressor